MFTRGIVAVFAAATAVAAQGPDEDGRYTISAPGIKAQVSESGYPWVQFRR